MDDQNPNIITKLRELRRARGLTVNTLAQKMGENYQKVGRIERGKRSLTIDYLMKISKALEAPVESLLTDDKDGNSEQKGASPDILNNIIVLVEEYCKTAQLSSKQKAKMISKIYELVLKFPGDYQDIYLNSLFETISFIHKNSEE